MLCDRLKARSVAHMLADLSAAELMWWRELMALEHEERKEAERAR